MNAEERKEWLWDKAKLAAGCRFSDEVEEFCFCSGDWFEPAERLRFLWAAYLGLEGPAAGDSAIGSMMESACLAAYENGITAALRALGVPDGKVPEDAGFCLDEWDENDRAALVAQIVAAQASKTAAGVAQPEVG